MEEKRAFELLDKKDPKGVSELLRRYYGKAAENFDTEVLTALREQFFRRVERVFFTRPYKDIAKVLARIIAMVDGHPPLPVHFLDKVLMLLDESDEGINENDRCSMAIFLCRFMRDHPDSVGFYSAGIERRLERLCAEYPDSEIRTILKGILLRIQKSFQRQRPLSTAKEGLYHG
ncbi:MAG: hypothetical protein Q8Q46_03350 [Candidatus Giovannonibacteria bacterium]|nr:hypothetical protein [Candidatus Giovannonibacteria bacterium]